jgi:hexokinase
MATDGGPAGGRCHSLYQHYPGFEVRMREALRVLLGQEVEKQIEMGLAKDGSGVGGA